MSAGAVGDGVAALAPAARLFGRLLLCELGAAELEELRRPDVEAALAQLGIALPDASALDELATRYFELFVHPKSSLPPVQSLWAEGRYDGDCALQVRAIARIAGRELASGARGAAPDHVGCVLTLWAELVPEQADLAARLAAVHLPWVEHALAPVASADGFYGAIAGRVIALVREIAATHEAGA